ncbi:MAG TPA: MOSC domain-containing protein [Candidatus Nanopelagicales bacterium]
MPATITAVCVVHALLPEPGNPDGTTAIDKRPVAGPVPVGLTGLRGDDQRDRQYHGGEEYAIYLYADEDAGWWAEQLGRAIPPGLFGENLRTTGLDVSGLVVGERLRLGEGVLLEVTSPRNPCATFAHRMAEPQWVRRFTEARRPGAYARVLEQGSIEAGDPVEVVARPEHAVTVAELMSPALPGCAAALLDAQARGLVGLGPRMRADAEREAARGGGSP